jgi:hypothetical protein
MYSNKIISVTYNNFYGKLRNGDILGICNILGHVRKVENDESVKIHVPEDLVLQPEFGIKFFNFVKNHTDYFSEEPGNLYFSFENINFWDYRSVIGDNIKVNNTNYVKENKICIFPIFDAPYNTYRNWSIELTNYILQKYKSDYKDYKVFLCVDKKLNSYYEKLNLDNVNLSFDFEENLNHILTCKIYVGGDTGTSHLAGSVTNPAINDYYYSCEGLLHTLPLNYKTNGNVKMYSKYGCSQ